MDNYNKLFANISHVKPPEGLSEVIYARIEGIKRRQAKIRIAYASFAGAVSLVASIPALQYCISSFTETGFWQYLSLLFSDGGVAIIYWKELLLSLAESLPVLGSAIILALAFVIVGSLKYIIENTRTLSTRIQLA